MQQVEKMLDDLNARQKNVSKLEESIIEIAGRMMQLRTEGESSLSETKRTEEAAAELLKEARSTTVRISEAEKLLQRTVADAERLTSELEVLQRSLESSSTQIDSLAQTVDNLLPGATSAGLADAFRQRKITIAKSKKWWLVGFIVSIAGLVASVYWILDEMSASQATDWWRSFAQRIPLTIPFIWAGWFFGRNFGHVIRLEEVYAFKQATSQSFEGYKKQMSEVSPVQGLPRLCDEAIGIFSASPLHVFDRRTLDETPMNSLWDKFAGKKVDPRQKSE